MRDRNTITENEMKSQIRDFRRFYPATVKAMGGPKGVLRWWKGEDPMTSRVARIWRRENSRILRYVEEFQVLDAIDLLGEVINQV